MGGGTETNIRTWVTKWSKVHAFVLILNLLSLGVLTVSLPGWRDEAKIRSTTKRISPFLHLLRRPRFGRNDPRSNFEIKSGYPGRCLVSPYFPQNTRIKHWDFKKHERQHSVSPWLNSFYFKIASVLFISTCSFVVGLETEMHCQQGMRVTVFFNTSSSTIGQAQPRPSARISLFDRQVTWHEGPEKRGKLKLSDGLLYATVCRWPSLRREWIRRQTIGPLADCSWRMSDTLEAFVE